MAQTHLILEIDDAEIVATLARRRRGTWDIIAVRRAEIAGAEGAALALGLRSALHGLDTQDAQVHLAFSERRLLHFVLEVPKMPKHELDSLIGRESRRLAGADQGTNMVWASRLLGRGAKGNRHAVVALSELAWQPVRTALQRSGIEAVSVTSLEEAASRVVSAGMPDNLLLLDLNHHRARLLYLDRGAVVQRRRLPPMGGSGGDSDSAAGIAAHLALELPRTIEYFANQGLKAPDGIAVSPLFAFDETMLATVAGALPLCPLPPFSWPLAQGDRQPGLPTHGLLIALLEGSSLSLVAGSQGVRRDLRPSLAAAVLSAAVLATGLAGVVRFGDQARTIDVELAAELTRIGSLQAEADHLTTAMDQRRPKQLEPELAAILSNRRPMSLFLAKLCEASASGIGLRELKLGTQTGVIVLGQVGGQNRMDALQRMSNFTSALQRLPFLTDDRGNLDPQQNDSGPIQFEFQATWGGGK